MKDKKTIIIIISVILIIFIGTIIIKNKKTKIIENKIDNIVSSENEIYTLYDEEGNIRVVTNDVRVVEFYKENPDYDPKMAPEDVELFPIEKEIQEDVNKISISGKY